MTDTESALRKEGEAVSEYECPKCHAFAVSPVVGNMCKCANCLWIGRGFTVSFDTPEQEERFYALLAPSGLIAE